jgi:NTE family protein
MAKTRPSPRLRKSAPRPITLALQGGGAHGAYTWGVLDQLLGDDRIVIEAVSGTSAGAMNAVVMAEGLAEGGRTQARRQLEAFWQAVGDRARFSPVQRTAWDILLGNWSLDFNPMLAAFDLVTHSISPYANPIYTNPLAPLLSAQVDFDRVRACTAVRIYVAATNAETGATRLFSNGDISLDAVLASACLPHVFRAVEIDGVPHWDGGYSANPPLEPLIDDCSSADLVLVQINPVRRPGTPRTAREIMNRINEISFNSALLKDLHQIEFVNAALRRGDLVGQGHREIFLHVIGGGADLAALSASSKLNAEWAFLTHLRDLGRRDAETWLDAHHACLGVRSSHDLARLRQTA